MSQSVEQKLLKEYLESAFSAGKRLLISYKDTQPFFPMTAGALDATSDLDEIRIDALLYRFGSTLSITQDHVFKAIAVVEGEDISSSSKRDIGNLMEKLGAIREVGEFSSFSRLRSRLFHAYPDDQEKQVKIINEVHAGCKGLLFALSKVSDYISDKKLVDDPPEFWRAEAHSPFDEAHHKSQDLSSSEPK